VPDSPAAPQVAGMPKHRLINLSLNVLKNVTLLCHQKEQQPLHPSTLNFGIVTNHQTTNPIPVPSHYL